MKRIVVALALVVLPSLTLVKAQTQKLPAPSAGLWHLLEKGQDEQNIPDHRMDLRLYPTPEPFRAAIVDRNTGDDIPYPVAKFDGRILTLQMGTHGAPPTPDIPVLKMTWDGTRFEGTYVDAASQPLAKARSLKLVKSRQ